MNLLLIRDKIDKIYAHTWLQCCVWLEAALVYWAIYFPSAAMKITRTGGVLHVIFQQLYPFIKSDVWPKKYFKYQLSAIYNINVILISKCYQIHICRSVNLWTGLLHVFAQNGQWCVTYYSTLMVILPMPCWGCRVKPHGMAVPSDAFTHIIPFLFKFSIW